MKRVLIITYYWPPSGGSGVQRWLKMSRFLPSNGWQPVIFTPENPAAGLTDITLEKDIPEAAEVVKLPILEPGQFTSKSSSGAVNPINSGKKTLKQRIALWVRANLFIPDPRILWVRPSVRFLLKYLKEHPVDAIISSGPPHSMHLIAMKVTGKTGLPWIADFRDPWTKMFYFKHLPLCRRALAKHRKLEKQVLDTASAVVSASPAVRSEFASLTETDVHFIPNGYDDVDFSGAPDKNGTEQDFTVVHAGLLSSDGNPVNVWKVLGKLVETFPSFREKFKLILCGKTDREVLAAIAAEGLSEYTENLGYLSHTDSIQLMKRASVLLLPLRQEPESCKILPGKLFEYLAARRPILGIDTPDGAMASIISQCKAGDTFDWESEESVRLWIEDKFRQQENGGIPTNDSEEVERYSRKPLTAKYAFLLNSITGRNP